MAKNIFQDVWQQTQVGRVEGDKFYYNLYRNENTLDARVVFSGRLFNRKTKQLLKDAPILQGRTLEAVEAAAKRKLGVT